MIKRVDRYIGHATLLGILAVWVGLTLLMLMFSLLDELRSMRGGYGIDDVFWFVVLTVPSAAYEVFPVAALLGALLGVGGLAAANELVAFRTAGVSRLRLAGAAMAGTLIVTSLVIVMGEWLAPAAEQRARAFRLSEMVGQVIIGGPRGMWMRDGNDIVNIQRPVLTVEEDGQSVNFRDVVIYGFGADARLERITRAERAAYEGEAWTFDGVETVELGPDAVRMERDETLPWASTVRPALLDSAVTRPRYMSVRALWQQIAYLEQNGLDTRVYESAFWRRVFFPFAVVALVLAGMPFVFGSTRSQNFGVRIFVGMALGGMFMILNRTAQNLAEAYGLPAAAAAAAPSLLLATVAVLVLRRSV
jgi:lipopolysaccharide export system permease protein